MSLFHWNLVGHRLWNMIFLAVCGTVAKQTLSFSLLLMGALGWGVTTPSLRGGTICRIVLLATGFFAAELVRLFTTVENEHVVAPAPDKLHVILIVAPGSLFLAGFCVWTLLALNGTIEELAVKGQEVKLNVYLTLRTALSAAGGVVLCGLVVDWFVWRREDMATNWEHGWVMSDALSHALCFRRREIPYFSLFRRHFTPLFYRVSEIFLTLFRIPL